MNYCRECLASDSRIPLSLINSTLYPWIYRWNTISSTAEVPAIRVVRKFPPKCEKDHGKVQQSWELRSTSIRETRADHKRVDIQVWRPALLATVAFTDVWTFINANKEDRKELNSGIYFGDSNISHVYFDFNLSQSFNFIDSYAESSNEKKGGKCRCKKKRRRREGRGRIQ